MESQDKGFFYNAKESLVGILATLTACIVLGIIAARLFREGGASMFIGFLWVTLAVASFVGFLFYATDLRRSMRSRNATKRHS